MDDNPPLVFRIELCDLRLKQTRLRAKPRVPDIYLSTAQRFFSSIVIPPNMKM